MEHIFNYKNNINYLVVNKVFSKYYFGVYAFLTGHIDISHLMRYILDELCNNGPIKINLSFINRPICNRFVVSYYSY